MLIDKAICAIIILNKINSGVQPMENYYDEVQNKYLELTNFDFSHGGVSAVKVPNVTVYSTNRKVTERVAIYEKLKKAELVKQHGEDASYDIGTYNLHMGRLRDGYSSFKQDARCAMLYKEGQAEKFDSPEHVTLVLSDSLEEQAEYINIIRDAHCEKYNISLNRGYQNTETPYIEVSGAFENQFMDPVFAHNRGDFIVLNARLTALGLEENFHPVEPATEQ